LAVPIILSNLSVPLVGAVDTAVVGHLPDPVYIGAVALGALIFSFLFWGFGFLRMGTTGLIAQAFGAGEGNEVRNILARAFILAFGFGVLIVVLKHQIGTFAFWLLHGGDELESLANQYFTIRVWGAPAVLANYAILGFLIGLQNTRAALVTQLTLNLTNVALDLWFVLHLGWGVEGVAIASVISEYIALCCGLAIIYWNLRQIQGRWSRIDILHREKLRDFLKLNFDIFVRTLCLIFAFSYFTARSTDFGETILATNAVLLHLLTMMAYGLDGFAHAVEGLGGSAYGANSQKAFKAAVFYTTLWAFFVAVAITIAYVIFGQWIVSWLTSIKSVQLEAARYLPWLVASPLLSVWSFQLDGIYIGITRTVAMRNAMLLSLAAYLFVVWLLVPLFGNHGLWLALMIFMVVRAITLGLWLPRVIRSFGSD